MIFAELNFGTLFSDSSALSTNRQNPITKRILFQKWRQRDKERQMEREKKP